MTKDEETEAGGVAAYPDEMSVCGVQREINSAAAEGLTSLEMLAPIDDQ